MKVKVDKYYVTKDDRNYILNECHLTKKGGKVLRPVAYYPKIEQLLDGIFERLVETSDCESIQSLRMEIERCTRLVEAFKSRIWAMSAPDKKEGLKTASRPYPIE